MSPNDDDEAGRDLLAHARSGMTPGAADKARMRARLLVSVGAAGAVSAGTATAAASAGTPAALAGWGAKMVIAALAATVLGGAVMAVIATRSPAHETTAPVVEARVAPPEPSRESAPLPATPSVREDAEDVTAPGALEAAPAPATPAIRPRREAAERVVEPLPAPPIALDTLAEENALIGRARRALRSEDPRAALAALDEHARRYADGMLAEERDVQRVHAYCALGDVARAEAEARRFVREHPSSLSVEAMAEPCAR